MWAAGDHDDDSKHARQTGLELVLKMAECKDGDGLKKVATAVSYTHLTLPTICSV